MLGSMRRTDSQAMATTDPSQPTTLKAEAGAFLPAACEPYRFPEPLREGVILARPNRFIMDVALNGQTVRCHCPAVSRIGGLDLSGRPCLMSDSHNPKRKMPLTVEAYSLALPAAPSKAWIGINQNASNRYVEHFLREGAFAAFAPSPTDIRREVPLGSSRMDFCAESDGGTLYLEVKTPLVQMQTDVPDYVPRLPEAPFSSTERSLRHLRELAQALSGEAKAHGSASPAEAHSGSIAPVAARAIVLYCLHYDNFGFRFYHGTTYEEVRATVDECRAAGVELWQADFEVTPEAVRLKRYWPLEEW